MTDVGVEERITKIESRLEVLEVQQFEYNKKIVEVDSKVDDISGKIDTEFKNVFDGNAYLSRLLDTQVDQNNKILSKVLEGNQKTEERDSELKRTRMLNVTQLCMTLLSSGGLIFMVVQFFINR